jgi:putative N6-adenine-specific DNA methylase
VAIINPPYGQRMEKQYIIAFYKKIGDVLKRKYGGWRVWIFTANLDAAKFIGLKPSRKIILYNGPLEGRFLEFELYSGSRKGKNAGDGRKS